MTEQAAVVGTCAVCDQIILTPAPGVVVSQLGDGDQQEDGTFIYLSLIHISEPTRPY